jgi:hypothetical protein
MPLAPGLNVTSIFTIVIYKCLMYASKTKAYPSEAPFRGSLPFLKTLDEAVNS